ncbi:hypothetical protein [Archangium sp.]|uniref:hypothetical protein n=1 Tax=Archangium sp. TaxID=1872627 RepID=UPI002D405B93|nr:hypothetical protein [Archangium sp.]HYO54861.1 hypothetical protein [Archangium sp.]
MKVDYINTDNDSKWRTGQTVKCPCSSHSSTALEIEFEPLHGPRVSGHFEPALDSQLIIFFETTHISAERMLHITPDEIWLEVSGRFLIQTSGVRPSIPLPSFLRCQEYTEGKLLLGLGRYGTFRIEAILGHASHHVSAEAHRKDLRMAIKFLGHCDHKGGPS